MPVNTLRRIVVAVPDKAEYEKGFLKWMTQLCRMGKQLGCRVHFFATEDTLKHLRALTEKQEANTFTEFSLLEEWDDLLLLTGQVNYDHLFVVVSSRKGSISYQTSFERLPSQISKYFANNSLLIVYPDQLGDDPQEIVSFSDPRGQSETRVYDNVGKMGSTNGLRKVMNEINIEWQQRTELLLGKDKMKRLRHAHVLVVGLGGVGAYAAEMICRAGVGRMTIVDADIVQPSNINRQLSALYSTMGRPKAEILAERFRDINPDLELTVLVEYLKDERIPELLDSAKFDFVVDAIDTVAPKCYLIYNVLQRRLPIVSSMGAGAKWDITQVRFADFMGILYHCGLSQSRAEAFAEMGMKRKTSGCI